MKRTIILITLATSLLIFSGCEGPSSSDQILTKEQLINRIMEAPGKADSATADFNSATQTEKNKLDEKTATIIAQLKTDLRKLHALDPNKADQIIDENFPGLMRGGNPLWVRKNTPAAPAAPTITPVQPAK